MKIHKYSILLILSPIIASCVSAFDANDYSYKEYAYYFGVKLPKADVYLRYPATMSFREAHQKLISSSKDYVLKKCNQTERYYLYNFKLYPSQWRNLYITYPVISADISCKAKDGKAYPIFDKMSLEAAEKECSGLGFISNTGDMEKCVSELTTN